MSGRPERQIAAPLRHRKAGRQARSAVAGARGDPWRQQVLVSRGCDAQCADGHRQCGATLGRVRATHGTRRQTTPCPAAAEPRCRPVRQERRRPAASRDDQRSRGTDHINIS